MSAEKPREKVAIGESLSASDLREMLKAPLGRLRIPAPSIETCEELVIWIWRGPSSHVDRPILLSDKPARNLVALRNSLHEAENFWNGVLAASRPSEDMVESQERFAVEIKKPFARLRAALDECEPLVRKQPPDYKESWENAAVSLATVFKWVVGRSGSNAQSGLSKGGPSFTFIYGGLQKLGWVNGTTPTEDAVLQFLKRFRKDGDIRF